MCTAFSSQLKRLFWDLQVGYTSANPTDFMKSLEASPVVLLPSPPPPLSTTTPSTHTHTNITTFPSQLPIGIQLDSADVYTTVVSQLDSVPQVKSSP
jgi:hypothetical protein